MTLPTTGPAAQVNPDAFMGRVTLSAYEPYPVISGSGISSFSASASPVVHWIQPTPVIVQNVMMCNSLSPGVPGATSQASSGSQAFSYGLSAYLYRRQDYSSSSTQLSFMTSGSFGLTATLSYTSTAQTFGMSWATDSSGGSSGMSTTSSDAAWSVYGSGLRLFSLPFVTTLPAGEYWFAFQHSSTSNTSNSNITLLSMSQLDANAQAGNVGPPGYLGQSGVNASVVGPNHVAGFIAGAPVTAATMALSTIVQGVRAHWFALSNA